MPQYNLTKISDVKLLQLLLVETQMCPLSSGVCLGACWGQGEAVSEDQVGLTNEVIEVVQGPLSCRLSQAAFFNLATFI